jgi:glutathione S-transferase
VTCESYTLIDLYYTPRMLRLLAVGQGNLITSHKAVIAWCDCCVIRLAYHRVLAADTGAADAADGSKENIRR